jgi:membrane associated rhomboid family serine protease
MIPIGDEGVPERRGLPIVNLSIIALNILMFFYQLTTGLDNGPVTLGWSFVPAEISQGRDIVGCDTGLQGLCLAPAPLGVPWLTLITSMFMHGGWLHIASNMLFLFIFGDNVEDNMGSIKYLIFYLLCGLAATSAQYFLGGPNSTIPNLGASGAIAGVMGAYLVLFRGATVRTAIILGYFITIARVPAFIMLGFWIATQIASVFLIQEQTPGEGGGVAYWAHIGGFVAGVVLAFLFGDRQRAASPAYARGT